MNKDFQPGDKVELQHKDTSFYDPETELAIANREQARLTDPIGRKTRTALLSGRLLVVSSPKPKAVKAASDEGQVTSDEPASAPAPAPAKKAPAKKTQNG